VRIPSAPWATVRTVGLLAVAWGTVAVFAASGGAWLADPRASVGTVVLFLWLLTVVSWSAFGVVREADRLAELLGEPLGTLVLTVSVIVIEVALIAAVMIGARDVPALGRDTMFALLMIVLNGVVGLALLLGGLRHHEQDYNLQGAVAYLAVIIPLAVFALVLPNFTRSTPGPTLSTVQGVSFALFTTLLYGVFLGIQTVRHRGFFVEPRRPGAVLPAAEVDAHPAAPGDVARHAVVLLVTMLPIVLLAKQLAKLVDHGISVLGAPSAVGGVLIALIVLAPESVSALRAAVDNQLQRAVNLCLGAALSTIGLTVPAVLGIGLVTGQRVVLGVEPTSMVLLAVTLVVSMLTFSGSPTTVLAGAVHLVLFFVYVVLLFSP
jgi:Ca2+:H+ antiporter